MGVTALDLINQLRGQNFSPDLAEQAVQSKEYGQMPATYKPQQPLPPESPTAGRDFGSTFWDKLYRNLEGSGQAMREGARGMTIPGEKRALAPLQALLGVLGGAFAIPGAATEHFIAEPVSQAIGGKTGAFAGGVAEQLPYLGLGALGKGAGQAGRVTGKIPPTYRKAGGAKIPRVMPGKATYTDKTGFGAETMERRGPGRMSDEAWATQATPTPQGIANPSERAAFYRKEAQRTKGTPWSDYYAGQAAEMDRMTPTYQTLQTMQKTPQASQTFRDPISHRQTDLDPGFFGPLIENYYKTLMGEGIGPKIAGGASTPMASEAPRVSELTRPWPGVYKGGEARGRTQPKSYRSPKTYDLSEYE